MTPYQLLEEINCGNLDEQLTLLYGANALTAARKRYTDAINRFCEIYGADRQISLFSVAGRITELKSQSQNALLLNSVKAVVERSIDCRE